MSVEEQKILKKIDTEQKFSDVVFKSARSERFGITFCCPLDLEKISIKKELCDWQDSKLPVYKKKAYSEITYEITTPPTPLPDWAIQCGWVDADGNGLPDISECEEDVTCVLVEVVNQDGHPIEGYPVIIDGGNIGNTDEFGRIRHTISNASVDTEHILDLCHCFQTTGLCSEMKITITLTEECPAEECSTPVAICP